jgi:hypothetical protein
MEEEYQNRKILYENKDIFYELLKDNTVQEETQEHKEINDAIVKGQEMLKDAIVDYNKSHIEKQKIDDILKSSKNISFDMQAKMDYLKSICLNNDIKIDNLQDTIDQIQYSILYITESMETALQEKKEDIESKMVTSRSTLKHLSKAYNVLRTTSVSYTCPVCISNQVDSFIDPCGHCLCNKCLKNATHCYFCRARISRVVKLFFML